MGKFNKPFHFLGVLFEVPQSLHDKTQVSLQIHPRSCRRALDRLKAMQQDAVHPATKQRYLIRWASWWSDAIQSIGILSLIVSWVRFTAVRDPTAVWLGRGLLPKRFCDT